MSYYLPDLLKQVTRRFLWLSLNAAWIGALVVCLYATIRDMVVGHWSVPVGVILLLVEVVMIVGSLRLMRRFSSEILALCRTMFCLDAVARLNPQHATYKFIVDYVRAHGAQL